jgi:two-component system, chemotaxis family, chemotaxis protein CheY
MKKILLIENDESQCRLLNKILNKKYDLTTFHNGLDAFSWLVYGNLPDLIISDLNNPVISGFELLKNLSISGLYKNIPMIMISGVVDPEVRKRCMDAGAVAYFVKPFEPEKLLSEIELQFVSEMFL